uniref:Uncharacterized protein n=1 Tax=Peronospora matthiolae TaxID=2874970 RepID=A0AAV1VM72_9STRA
MRTGAFLYALLLAALAPAASPQECGKDTLGHNRVEAFDQQDPVTEVEKTAVRLNPTIFVGKGCAPYPAVNYRGQLSEGLKPTGPDDGNCRGSRHGSQVYGRATQYNTKWAFMFAFYSPKIQGKLHNARHDWNIALFWMNHLKEAEKIDVLVLMNYRCGLSQKSKFEPYEMDGDRVKLALGGDDLTLEVTSGNGGRTLPLIMWEQLTDEARNALNCTTWGTDFKMPLVDDEFHSILEKTWHVI